MANDVIIVGADIIGAARALAAAVGTCQLSIAPQPPVARPRPARATSSRPTQGPAMNWQLPSTHRLSERPPSPKAPNSCGGLPVVERACRRDQHKLDQRVNRRTHERAK